MKINSEIHVITEEKMIYKIESVRQLDSKEYGLLYNLELVAGYDYVNPDLSDAQGFVNADRFIDDVQLHSFTLYPMEENLGERLEEEGFKVIDIKNYNINWRWGESPFTFKPQF